MNVDGFKAAALAAGLRKEDHLDLGLIAADEPVAVAGVFTRNTVQAAPVLWSRARVAKGRAQAILVNSGQANACTGPEGMEAASQTARAVAQELGCGEDEVLLASTGVIGEPLNQEAMIRALPNLKAGLGKDQLPEVARAMMTTDTRPKIVKSEGKIDGRPFKIVGLAKGAGMIAPNMATLLSFILTDAVIQAKPLQDVLGPAVEATFNRITVDGDTSTNDTVLILASGRAGFKPLTPEEPANWKVFEQALRHVLADLARLLITDAEGATRLVHVIVSGAADDTQAREAAMTVANSPLVKTALFGQDANWGRIMAALGRSRAAFDPEQVSILFDQALLVRQGRLAGDEAKAAQVMRQDEFSISIDLGAGSGQAEVLTCDMSYDYVRLNADYRS
ncbi:MAG: bifunctional glutamate N-acetyltransferase/amino-acid acetyltransferase ArgJ [Deltaproteobacteria bacterium]|nr:bifunctional glutamate N-acetyltransferase/amino-acid acetyltransferase ArgJ [Deltaproteobacteria bacterium]MBW2085932.1 bifunctional glutamate N-acetyltransferase/amino-acid acetyltransferase ArgJ [Deltaproteobacteria bacterium]